MKLRKKLIEVALPLEAINIASAREKSIRHGHPSTLHLWWARRPLAAARAVIFAQMVDDPSSHPELFPTEEAQETERQRIFRILEKLVLWENTTNEAVLNEARLEIWKSWRSTCEDNRDHPQAAVLFNPDKLPAFHDPFAGGGALPLEAQRLGLESYASDLNPVAVTINKAMIEIPPRFAGRKPVGPIPEGEKQTSMAREWPGASGLAEDVRRYGAWMRREAERRIGHLYPKVEITEQMAEERPDLKPLIGEKLTVVAWLWARTVKSPDPAFANVDVPLASSFVLCPMAGKEAYVDPVIENGSFRFTVKVGQPANTEAAESGTKLSGRGANFRCLLSGAPISGTYIKDEAKAGRMGARLMAIVAEGNRSRVYLSPEPSHESLAQSARPAWKPEGEIATRMTGGNCTPYGLESWGDLFSSRQLVALTAFSDLVEEVRLKVKADAEHSGIMLDSTPLEEGGRGADAYADAVAVYLAFLISKLADKGSTLCTWDSGPKSNRTSTGRSARVATVRVTFGRQALPMTWDYAEVNFFSDSVGSMETVLKTLTAPLDYFPIHAALGKALQSNAAVLPDGFPVSITSSDPPYYDNIGYADLSDFFYVWLRRTLRNVLPGLFTTLAVPKAEELVATPYRHGGKAQAEAFFLSGMTTVMRRLATQSYPSFPVTIYYAFKQAETDERDGTSSTGWETFLEAVIQAGFALTGTWPMRTELSNRMIGSGTNALASSIVLVCRKRDADAPSLTRREFLNELKNAMPVALAKLQHSNIAPVDLQQAAIGPGIAIYSGYSRVVNAAGDAMPVKEALALINETLDDVLAEQEGDFDADTRWALTWFDQMGFAEGDYGLAETLSKAKNTSVAGMMDAGILSSGGGKVRLLKPEELNADWEPETDTRKPVWEALHHLVRALNQGGETSAAALSARLGSRADAARELAYRLYILCERKKRAQEALAYNALVQSWPEIQRLASEAESRPAQPQQTSMFS